MCFLFTDFSDPADDPDSPSYRITAEHFPSYLLPLKKNLKASDYPLEENKQERETSNDPEQVPLPQRLQHNKDEVIIRAEDFADIQFIGE